MGLVRYLCFAAPTQLTKALIEQEKCKVAVEASVRLEGYGGPSAEEMYERGQGAFSAVYAEFKEIKREEATRSALLVSGSQQSQVNETTEVIGHVDSASAQGSFCPVLLKSGHRAGLACGRKRPCRYHDQQSGAAMGFGLFSLIRWMWPDLARASKNT